MKKYDCGKGKVYEEKKSLISFFHLDSFIKKLSLNQKLEVSVKKLFRCLHDKTFPLIHIYIQNINIMSIYIF